MGNCHMYIEYLSILLVNLLQQGFTNPGIFVPEYSLAPESVHPTQLTNITRGYEYLSTSQPGSYLVVAGDSNGGTLALSLLLHIGKPCKSVLEDVEDLKQQNTSFGNTNFLSQANDTNIIGQSTELDMTIEQKDDKAKESFVTLKKPAAAILISPIPNLFSKCSKDSENVDYLSTEIINRWGKLYVDRSDMRDQNIEENVYHSPGLCEDESWWSKAFPTHGIILSYGKNEVLFDELEDLATMLKKHGKVKVDCRDARTHNWALLGFYGEKDIEHRESSIQHYATVLSRMLLWHTEGYFQPGTKEPTNTITIDNQYV